MDQTKSKLQKKRLESAEERRARLDKANKRARAKRRMETQEQKKNEARKKECNRQVQTNIKSQDVIVVIIYLFIYFPNFSFGLA